MSRAVALVLLLCAAMVAQIRVDEKVTKAKVVDGVTTILLALQNESLDPVDTQISLQWLDPSNKSLVSKSVAFQAKRGRSVARIPLSIAGFIEPLFLRLHYKVEPSNSAAAGLQPVEGIVSLTKIADHAFRLTGMGLGGLSPEKPRDLRVIATHPVTKVPVGGVTLSVDGEVLGRTRSDGLAVLRLPPSEVDDPDEDYDVLVEGKLGDLEQDTLIDVPQLSRASINVYSDKPLYQPGQTAHLRMLAFAPDRTARAKVKYRIKIDGDDGIPLHLARVETSEFGVAHTDWEIPPNAQDGTYDVEVLNEQEGLVGNHRIVVRRYELPSFRVTTKLDRTFYLPGQKALLKVRADYLFGKPVSAGRVRICEDEDSDDPIYEGDLTADGSAEVTLSPEVDFDEYTSPRFVDQHYVAYVTDASTNRTEKRAFDVRVSKGPLHIYVLTNFLAEGVGPVYVATYAADGAPVSVEVEALSDGRVVASGRSNALGVAKLQLEAREDQAFHFRAKGILASTEEEVRVGFRPSRSLTLRTEKVLHMPGEAIVGSLHSDQTSLPILVLGWSESGDVLFSKSLKLKAGSANIRIPYQRRFGRRVFLQVLSPQGNDYQTGSLVLYPGIEDLQIISDPAADSYRPGEEASVSIRTRSSDGKALRTALGVAVVDQAVFERKYSDASGKRYRWFRWSDWDGNTSIGGYTLADLLNLRPEEITPELQLVAEALLQARQDWIADRSSFEEEQAVVFRRGLNDELDRYVSALNEVYKASALYPHSEEESAQLTKLTVPLDPWRQRYQQDFTTARTRSLQSFRSAGPDKVFGTDDDFTARTIGREWFLPTQKRIAEALEKLDDYPATPADVESLLRSKGIVIESLRDPLGAALHMKISHYRDRQILSFQSEGPDGVLDTKDDFSVASFYGSYLSAISSKVNASLGEYETFPRNEEQFRERAKAAGVDLDTLLDPWGMPYTVSLREEDRYGSNFVFYTHATYNSGEETRTRTFPTHTHELTWELRSSGPDGLRDNRDDFVITRFSRYQMVDTSSSTAIPTDTLAPIASGGERTGWIAGKVMDASGSAIPGATVRLNERMSVETDSTGNFDFQKIPEGKYVLRVIATGFRSYHLVDIPAVNGVVTSVNVVLQIGSITETVDVVSDAPLLNTETASISVEQKETGTASTPRLREYFPETLYWAPEIITDKAGRATLKFKMADSITNWKVGVVASTADGRIAESTTDIRAFQPFFVDLDPPSVLTVGDEISLSTPIRNYLPDSETVVVEAAGGAGMSLQGDTKQKLTIPSGESRNVSLRAHANDTNAKASLKVTATGKGGGDAIVKTMRIHPDGEGMSSASNTWVQSERGALRLDIPANAIPGSVHAELKIYPDLFAHLVESMEALVRVPHGCAEQTISAAYPNLLYLRAVKAAGVDGGAAAKRAIRNLETGYRRLLFYRSNDGGFGYWSGTSANLAVTAYALGFLQELSEVIDVEPTVIEEAQQYLEKNYPATALEQSLVLSALTRITPKTAPMLKQRLQTIAASETAFQNPYTAATLVLTALRLEDDQLAQFGIERLQSLTERDGESIWWTPSANTPFYGWARAGRLETTALVVSALAQWQTRHGRDPQLAKFIEAGVAYLIREKDARGIWLTGQATIRVFQALIDGIASTAGQKADVVQVLVDSVPAGEVRLATGAAADGPKHIDLSRFVKPGSANEITVASKNGKLNAQVQASAEWYQPWAARRESPHFKLDVQYSSTTASVNDVITCDVNVIRPAYRNYGMMLVEVGLPPGAEVDRSSLDAVLEDSYSVNSYEVAPDRVTFYVWPTKDQTSFDFNFQPRFPMRAKSEPSSVSDYYNPDARLVLPPQDFVVKQAEQ